MLQIGVREGGFPGRVARAFPGRVASGLGMREGCRHPAYLTAMTKLGCIFRHPHDRVVVHSSTREITDAVPTGEAALTRLDGIGWLRFSQESWED